jgi:hypothetical protein
VTDDRLDRQYLSSMAAKVGVNDLLQQAYRLANEGRD